MHVYNSIKNGNTSIEKLEEDQNQFKLNLNEITRGNIKNKPKDQLNTIENVKNFYNSREGVIESYNDYTKIMFEAKYKAKHGTGLKILTTKKMLQNLPIALT